MEKNLKIVDAYGRSIPRSALYADYEGASAGRRLAAWGTSGSGVNSSIIGSLGSLRSRSRELIRNNPLVSGGTDGYVANLIGSGISPRWLLADKVLKADIQQLWADFMLESDFDGLLSGYGQQSLTSRGLIDAGESLTRFIYYEPSEDLAVPLKLQTMEADHLDHSFNGTALTGNEIRMGIEVTKKQQKIAYHLFRQHPGEIYSMSNDTTREVVPAHEIIHTFRPIRAGQLRGRPWLASIIVKLHELDQYEDAELVRKKTAAMFGGFITEEAGQPDPSAYLGTRQEADTTGREIIALEPGTFPVLPKGLSVTFSQPTDVGITTGVWLKQQIREIAVGMGVTYEQLTGDLSGVNYSSIRAGLLEFRRRCQQVQFEIIIFQYCQRIAREFLIVAVLSNRIKIPDFFKNMRKYLRIKWRPDGWDWVDPLKDQQAEQLSVRSGFKSRSQVIAGQPGGRDIEDVDAEIKEDNDRADKNEFVFDSDPRKVTKVGVAQVEPDPATPPDNGGNKNE